MLAVLRAHLGFIIMDLKHIQSVWVCFSPAAFTGMGHTGTGVLIRPECWVG